MSIADLARAFGRPEAWILENARNLLANGEATLTDGVCELVPHGLAADTEPVAVVPEPPLQSAVATAPPAPPSGRDPNRDIKAPPRRRR